MSTAISNQSKIGFETSGNACGYCHSTPSKMQRCSRCHFEKYCNVKCQKAHWPEHKKVCVIKVENKEEMEKKSAFAFEATLLETPTPISGLRYIENFISSELHDSFVAQMPHGIPQKSLGHYDGYVFRNVEAFDKVFLTLVKDIFSKLKKLNYFSDEKKPLKLTCSIIGYEKNGFIAPHIDSPLVSGKTVIAVSFKSPVVVNFYSKDGTQGHHKIFVSPRSMYSLSGEARYNWSHAIISDESTYNSVPFERGQRYALLFSPPGTTETGAEMLDFEENCSA